jgi:hypothetical protein
MYEGEPISAPCVVRLESPVVVAMPKSVRQARPARSTRTFAGLTSRCTMPASCAASSTSSTSRPMRATAAGGSGPCPSSISCRLRAGDVLHHQPGLAVLLHDVVHGRDVGVVEPGGGAGLAHRPFPEDAALLVAEIDREGDLLQGHLAFEHLVGRQPDRAHASAAQDVGERVATRDHAVAASGVGAHGRRVPRSRA